MAPAVMGQIIPMAKIATGTKRPILWLRRRQNAIALATEWTRNEENSAHRNTWYHISAMRRAANLSKSMCRFIVHSKKTPKPLVHASITVRTEVYEADD